MRLARRLVAQSGHSSLHSLNDFSPARELCGSGIADIVPPQSHQAKPAENVGMQGEKT
jgi:hypothetical protein